MPLQQESQLPRGARERQVVSCITLRFLQS